MTSAPRPPNTALLGARVIDPANQIDAHLNVYLADGHIAALGQQPDGFEIERELRVDGAIACPGLVDLCARFREPGQENKATIDSEAKAAVKGGITSLCIPPDTIPIIDSPAMLELIEEHAQQSGLVNLIPIGGLTKQLEGIELADMGALKGAGCQLVSNANQPIANLQVLQRSLEFAASFQQVVMIHPNDFWLSGQGVIHQGATSTRLGLPGIPTTAETIAVAQIIALAEQIGGHVHFSQLSCQRSVQILSRAQYDGVRVTADVAAHQLHLTDDSVDGFNAMAYVLPPLRSEQDKQGLRHGVNQKIVSAICSDHQPHEDAAKLDVFSATEPGMSSLETLLPLSLKLVKEGCLSLNDAIARLTCDPAQIINLGRGTLSVGAIADVCIFCPAREWIVNSDNWSSQGRNTLLWGDTMTGQVLHTIHDGHLVYSV